MKPSVVFLQEQLRAAAGTERISTGVMNELADRGYQVVIVLFGTDKTSAFPLNDKIKILLIGIPFENKYKLKAAFYLKKIINEIKPDYVINVAVPMMQVSFLAKCLGMKGKVLLGIILLCLPVLNGVFSFGYLVHLFHTKRLF